MMQYKVRSINRSLVALALHGAVLAAALPGSADVISWKTNANGDWSNPANWDLGRLPTQLDDVFNTTAAAINFNTTSTVYDFTSSGPFLVTGGVLNGYSLNSKGMFQINNTFTLSGGGLNNLTVKPGSGGQGLTISGNNGQYFSNVILNCSLTMPSGSFAYIEGGSNALNGTALFTNGNLRFYNNSSGFTLGSTGLMHGYGVVDYYAPYGSYPAGGTLTNNGIISADDPTGKPFSLSIPSLINNATIKAEKGGTLYFTGGTLVGNGGTVGNADAGSVVAMNGGTVSGTVVGNGINGLQFTSNGGNAISNAVFNGLITMPSGGFAYIYNGGSVLNGTANFAGGDMQFYNNGSGITLSASGILRGFGTVDYYAPYGSYPAGGTLTNGGVITADTPGNALNLSIPNLVNSAAIKAEKGGILYITGGYLIGTNGTVGNVDANSFVGLNGGGVTGTLTGNGINGLQFTGNGNNNINNAVLNGLITMNNGGFAYIYNGGSILNGTANFGGGVARFYNNASGITLSASGLMHGFGTLDYYAPYGSYPAGGTLTNGGTINADDTTGKALNVSIPNLINNAAIKAEKGGILYFTGGTLIGNGGTVGNADAGSVVAMNGGTVSGTVVGNGLNGLQFTSNGNNTISNAVFNGLITMNNGGFAYVSGGSNVLNGTANFAGGAMRFYNSSASLVLNAGSVLRGFGSVDYYAPYGSYPAGGTLTNSGVITADTSSTALNLSIPSFINNATIKAEKGGILYFTGGTLVGNGGTVGNADAGSVVAMNGGTVSGTVVGNGVNGLQFTGSGNNYINNAIFNGLITMNNGGFSYLEGGNVLNGTANFAGGIMRFYNSSASLTLNAGSALHGFGTVDYYAPYGSYPAGGTLPNNGTISADVNGQALNFNVPVFTNHGTLSASGGALNLGAVQYSDGMIIANPGGSISFAGNLLQKTGVTTNNGAINTPSNGALILNSGSNIPGEAGMLNGAGAINGNVTNINGVVIPGYNLGALTVTGTYAQGAYGQLKIALGGVTPATQYTQLKVGTAALGGTLVIGLINGYQPHLGDTFQIITHAARSGSFGYVKSFL